MEDEREESRKGGMEEEMNGQEGRRKERTDGGTNTRTQRK